MVTTAEREDGTWYRCEHCGMLFDAESDARAHEENCDTDSPSYIQ